MQGGLRFHDAQHNHRGGGTEAAPVETGSAGSGRRKDTLLQPSPAAVKPKRHKICPSRRGDEPVSTCSRPSVPLQQHHSAAPLSLMPGSGKEINIHHKGAEHMEYE